MAIAVNEITEASNQTSPEAITINKPANVANGDVLVAFITQGYNRAVTGIPTDWVEYFDLGTTAGQNMRSGCYYKIITNAGGEPADYTWTIATASTTICGCIVRLSVVDTTTPVDAAESTADGEDWNEATPCPSMTTATANALVVAFMTIGGADTAGPNVPGDTTLLSDILCTDVAGSASLLTAYFTQVVAGATPTRLWSIDTVDSGAEYHVIQVAFRPAAAGALEADVNDSIVVSEAVIALLPLFLATASDAIVASESITALLPLLQASTSETVVVSEIVTALLPLLEVSVSDSVVVAESISAAVGTGELTVSEAESVVVTESVTALLPLYEVSVSDSVVVAESITEQLPLYEVSKSDSVVVTESVILSLPLYQTSVSDDVVVAESTTAQLPLYEASLSDSVVVADSATAQFPFYEVSVSDSIVVTESVTAQLPLYEVSEYESVVVSESSTAYKYVTSYDVSVSDSVVVAESVTPLLVTAIVGLPIISSQGIIHDKLFSGVIVRGHNK